MPGDTDDAQSRSCSTDNNNSDERFQQLIHYVHIKAAQEPDDAIVDFVLTEKACRLLFSKLLAAQKSHDFSNNAFANFLDVLSNAESYRLSIAGQADTALVWHAYYSKEDPKQALTDKEAETLKEILDHRDEWRVIYMKIVRRTVALDLYYHFISHPWFLSDFMVRLLEYNPSGFKPTNGYMPCPRNFVQFLSEDEQESIRERCKESLQSIRASHRWLQENYPNDMINGLYSKGFEDIHQPPTSLERLEDLLHYYLKWITRTYHIITTILLHQPS
ncbi:hypothetical protein P691DRAFT_718437 [Macrolepiota fuliginosa MF-IS2]|uniref:Uncharacterized protein n=1 Tax=Macrolepiota fuliginosa MF-IS2 TaxID=1400762 RepID=A0A9P5XM84_9AGAR|nr:hypothetical protein P691DRAFT_718437 [Macrolepiota fuliginosa MF-IS2]